MNELIKKEELPFEDEDAHVLGSDDPDDDQLELPKIAARQRKAKLVKKRGVGKKRKTRKAKTGTGKRKKATKRKKKTKTKGAKTFRRVKEPKLQIRHVEVMGLDDEDAPKPKVRRTAKPAVPKATPSDILDTIMSGQEKVFGTVDPKKIEEKKKVLSNGRTSVWAR